MISSLFIEGLLLQASLILALGAQNLFVLESGLKKNRHLLVAFICSLCDTLLIAVGVAGAASLFVKVPFLKVAFGGLGIFFLFYYGGKKIKEGLFYQNDQSEVIQVYSKLRKVILLTLSFSLLNPHVYLDTIILIGGYSTKFPELIDRIEFGLGAASFSFLWFFSLAVFSYYLSRFLKGEKSMRVVAFVSGMVLLVLGVKLGFEVYGWCRG